MKLKLMMWILVLFVLITFVNAKSPWDIVPEPFLFDEGLLIQTIAPPRHKINEDFFVHTHIYCSASGLQKIVGTEDICNFHVYAEHINWQHIYKSEPATLGDYGVEHTVNGSYFNETGFYSLLIWCSANATETSNESLFERVGGFTQYYFEVYDPQEPDDLDLNLSIMILLIISGIIFVGHFTKFNILGILGGLALVIYSFNIMYFNGLVGVVLMLCGFFISLFYGFRN